MATDIPATEVATLYLKEGVDVDDKSSSAHQIWQQTLATIAQQPGFRKLDYGLEIENPTFLQLLIDWGLCRLPPPFISSPAYAPFKAALKDLVSSPSSIHHVTFTSPSTTPPSTFISAVPVTEVATFFSTAADFPSNVAHFLSESRIASWAGFRGATFGSVVEEIAKPGVEDAEKGKAVMLFIGWESKDAHMRFRETEGFTQSIHYLRTGVGSAEIHHTVFKPYSP